MKRAGVLAIAGIALVAVVWAWFKAEPVASTAPDRSASAPAFHRNEEGPSTAAAKYAAQIAIARNRQDPQNPLASYVSKPGIAGRNELDRIFVLGVPLTEQSVLTVRALLKAGLSDDEKVALVRILGRLYSADNLTGYNADILLDLRSLINDNNKEVARSAALTFSRLGYLPGSDALLKSAFDNQVLSADDYYGELAHMTPLAPAGVRDELLTAIRVSSNAYAAEVLANAINENPVILSGYSARAVDELSRLLATTEPRFASATGEFGLTDAVRYASWLRASAQIDSLARGTDLDSAIVARLGIPGTDPRKITAYLLTPEASSILSTAPLGSPAGGLVSASSQYAAQYPGNKVLQSAAQNIASRAGRPKSKVP
jgi:hypothetical protein